MAHSAKERFHAFTELNSNEKIFQCYICEVPINPRVIHRYSTPMESRSGLDFVIRKDYQFLKKKLFTEDEIVNSNHSCSLELY